VKLVLFQTVGTPDAIPGLLTERGVLSADRAALSAAFPERIAAAAE